MGFSYNGSRRPSLRDRLDPTRWLGGLYLSACSRVGEGTRALGRPLVHNVGSIELGNHVTLRSLGSPVRLVTTASGAIAIGDDVFIDVGTHVFSERSVRIGHRVFVGPNVVICDRGEDGVVGEVIVEDGARIGAGVRIVGPCRIARDAIVPPGSVLRREAALIVPAEPRGDGYVNGTAAENKAAAPTANGSAKHGASSVPAPVRRVRVVLTADSTIDELAEYLAGPTEDALLVEAEVAPFDQVVPTLIGLPARDPKVDVALVWTRPDRVSPSFHDLIHAGLPAAPERILEEVDAFAAMLAEHARSVRFVFVASWVLPPWQRGMGMLDLRGSRAGASLMRMNLRLAEAIEKLPNVFVLDAQRWLAAASDGGVDPKLWHAGKVAFTTDVFAEAARDILAAIRGVMGMSRKLIVADLDDTVWGGIVGDVGWENLRLGGHDPDGEAFVQFQRQLVALTKRGIALAVVSKNEESTALDAMRSHPEMVIRPGVLAAFRINWKDKARNIVEIAEELNLGLQSVVFLDDNPIERGRVREALPEVLVPDWPVDPTHYPRALESLRCFDSPHVSAEDLERNAMYATERQRNSLRTQVSSFDDWLATLGLTVRFEPLGPANVARAAQLLNKTNQMNLRTRRLGETEFLAWSAGEGHEVWTVHVSDRFGNAGLTGLLGLAREGEAAHMTDFVLSCRVMGRRVEETMVWAGKRRAEALAANRLSISPIVTAKNKPCIDFFARGEGLGLRPADQGYTCVVNDAEPAPSLVKVEGLP